MKKIADAILFSSVFIMLCAVAMVLQTIQLLRLPHFNNWYIVFTAGGTVASYSIHWYFTDTHFGTNPRAINTWAVKYRNFFIPLAVSGFIAAGVSYIFLISCWHWLIFSVIFSFLYTAPKIPGKLSFLLRKIAVAKTIYLAIAWTYVTAILPFIISQQSISSSALAFILHRFFFLYALCILFDNRDREQDIKQGIRSLITILSVTGIRFIFYLSVAISIIAAVIFSLRKNQTLTGILLSVPVLLSGLIYPFIQNSKNDYLYHFALDGLMLLSFLFTAFQQV
jgi:4-hydroxybenzoate polyprenyltransferase